MHVVVVGCGRVGAGLARECEEAGHTVAVVDRREKSFVRLPDTFSGTTVVGVGFDRDRLIDAGIERAGALAAVTNGDNSNILVARIYDPRRAAIYERVGISTIATVQWATERVLQRILPERPGVDWIDPSAHVCLLERAVPSGWAGRRVAELDLVGATRVASITRLGVAGIPGPDAVVQEGDLVHVAVAGDAVDRFDRHLASPEKVGNH